MYKFMYLHSRLSVTYDEMLAFSLPVMRTQRGPRGQFSSLYGTTTLRLGPEFPYPPGGPRYERLVFDADGQLIVPLNEWYRSWKASVRRERVIPTWPCYGRGSGS